MCVLVVKKNMLPISVDAYFIGIFNLQFSLQRTIVLYKHSLSNTYCQENKIVNFRKLISPGLVNQIS